MGALTPNGHALTPENIILPRINLGMRGTGGWVPVGTEKFTAESAIGIARNRGAEQLERMLPRMADKQAPIIAKTMSSIHARLMAPCMFEVV